MLAIYAALFSTQLNYRFQYRINMLFWLIGVTTHSLIYVSVWQSVVRASNGSVKGFTAQDFAMYYLMLSLVQNVTVAPAPSLLARRIRTGDLSFRLLQPLHPIHRDIVENLAYKAPMLVFFIPFGLVFALLYDVHFNIPLWAAVLVPPALIGAAVLRFMLSYVVMNAAFWVTDTTGISQVHGILQTLFGGVLAPLPFLPGIMRPISDVMPFRWIFAFPIELALGRLTIYEASIGFTAQTAWIAVCVVLFRLLWRAGLRHFTAVGS